MRSALLTAARPALSAPRSSLTLTSLSLRHITIPAPETVPKEGETTTFVIRTDSTIDNPATALRLVRAVERELGPVIRIDLPKDQDMKRGFKFMSVQTLRPAALPEALQGELPPGRVDKDADTGGVSLADINAALGFQGDASASTKATKRMNYTVNARDGMRSRKNTAKPTHAERREDSELVSALRGFEGFFGGFKGVADRFAELEIPAPAQPPTYGGKPASVKAAEAAEAPEAAEVKVTKEEVKETKEAEAKELGPRKSFAEIVAEQRAAKEALAAQAQAQKVTPAQETQKEVKEEEALPEIDAVATRRERLQQQAIERARKAAAAAEAAAQAKAEEEARKVEEQMRAEQETKQEPPKKKGWF